MANILLIRLSAIGDVAMLLPLVYSVARANPQHRFTLLTQPFLTGLLIDPPRNLEAMAIDIRHNEKSLWELLCYAYRLRQEEFDWVLDLHDVLRTKVLRSVLNVFGSKVYRVYKPRAERKALLKNPERREEFAIPPMVTYYQQVFAQAGLLLEESIAPLRLPDPLLSYCRDLHPEIAEEGKLLLGIAPFASSEVKTFDLAKMYQLVESLSALPNLRIFLFGARGREKAELDGWAERLPSVVSVAGTMEFPDELALIKHLDLMVSMDSANMHLASLVGTRVLSIWCATHPTAGFLGLGQKRSDCLTPEDRLPYVPLSIFGSDKECCGKDMSCRSIYSVEEIRQRIVGILNETRSVDEQ